MKKSDQIEIKDLEKLAEVSGEDQIAVQRASDGKLYRADKDSVKGDQGDVATINAGTTTTGAPGTDASVVNSGTISEAVFDFTIPEGEKGDKGDKGDTGTAATADVHSTETGLAGTDAIVTNEGTTSAAEFKFVIPRGDTGATGPSGEKGDQGDQGLTWKGEWSAGTYEEDDAVQRLGTSYIANKATTETPSGTATDWDVLALKGTDGEGSGDMIASVYDPAGGEKQVAFDDDGRFTDNRTPLEHGNEKHSTNYLADISGESIGDLSDVTLTAEKTLTITDSTTLSGGTHSGTNTGDQVLPTRDSLGLDTDDSPRFAGIELGHADDTTLSRKEAGVLAVEGVAVESTANKRTSFQETPTDTAYASEKLVKDSLDEKVSIISYTNQLSWGAL
jgi:hypothetical protein